MPTRFGLALLSFTVVWAAAAERCDRELADEGPQLRVSMAAETFRVKREISPEDFEEIVNLGVEMAKAPLMPNNNIVFYHLNDKDYAFKIQIRQEQDGRIVDVRRAHPEEERSYYQTVAQLRSISHRWLNLPNALRGHRHLDVSPSVQAKLEIKHGLTLKKVLQAFRRPITKLWAEDFDQDNNGKPRFTIFGKLADGRMLQIVVLDNFESNRLCLVTAFPISKANFAKTIAERSARALTKAKDAINLTELLP